MDYKQCANSIIYIFAGIKIIKFYMIKSFPLIKTILLSFLIVSTYFGNAVNITTSPISGSPFCPGDSVYVSYTITGAFTNGNVFTAQLSNASGSFNAAVNIGTYNSNLAGTIPCMIPTNTPAGIHYRIRVYSSSPVDTGTMNNADLVVNAAPIPVITSNGNTTFCQGDSVELYNVAGGIVAYQWEKNLIAINGATSNTYYATTGGQYNMRGSNGTCWGTSGAIYVVVNSAPVVTFTGTDSICHGNGTNISAHGGNTYSWSPSTGLNTTSGANVVASPDSNTTYTVTSTGIDGCTGTASVTISVFNPPTVTVSPNDSFCIGGSAILTAGGAFTYTWSPSTYLNTSIGNTVTATPTSTANYTVTGNILGCTGTATVKVVVHQLPIIHVSGADSICSGSSTLLSASGAENYLWSPAVGLLDTVSANEWANPDSTVTYTITATDTFGCVGQDTFKLVVVLCTDINSVSDAGAISIYPNPATKILSVNFDNSVTPGSQLTITDIRGSVVYSNLLNKEAIDVSDFDKGVYILKIHSQNKDYFKKVVIE